MIGSPTPCQKDGPALLDLLDPEIDFRALTPGRFWEASSGAGTGRRVISGRGSKLTTASMRSRTCRPARSDRTGSATGSASPMPMASFLVEQQAYFDVENDRISWLRILCSGYVPIDDEPTSARPDHRRPMGCA